jgi:hypothetical protein
MSVSMVLGPPKWGFAIWLTSLVKGIIMPCLSIKNSNSLKKISMIGYNHNIRR